MSKNRQLFVLLASALLVILALAFVQQTHAQVLGVDLSAENIKVAAVRAGNPFHIVIDEQAKRKIPLAIAFDDDQRHFGNNAIGFALRKPFDTYLYAQRLLGQTMSSTRLTELRDSFGYNFVEIPGRGQAVGIKAPDGTIFSPEELVAMSLEHVLKLAVDDGNVGVKDVVITVPHWFSSTEKQALLQAAELAGMSVMSLVTDTGASSIQYGLDRQFENTNTTQHVCIIDVGASGTEMSYIQYQGVKQRSGSVKITGHAHVIASYSVENVGGHFIDKVLRNHFLDMIAQNLVNKPRKDGLTIDDIKKQPRAMAKLLKQAQAVKTVLSANQEAKIHVESVWKDIDLSGTIRRSHFEDLLAPQVAALDQAIQTFKGMLPKDFPGFDDVTIVGGTSRIPLIQTVLKQSFGVDRLGQTLNGDEAIVMGAVFLAANQSISFRVGPMLFTDANVGDVHVHIHDEPLTIDTNYAARAARDQDEINEEEKEKVVGKHVILFPKHSPVNKRKTLTLTSKNDMLVSVNHDTQDVCANCHAAIQGYKVDGVAQLYEDFLKSEVAKYEKEAELQLYRVPLNESMSEEERAAAIELSKIPPRGLRVSLTFTTAETTVPRLLSAEALVDDWVILDVTPKVPKKKPAKAKKAAAKKDGEEGTPEADKAAADAGDADDASKSKTQDSEQQEQQVEQEPEQPKQVWKLEKRIKRVPLTLVTLPLKLNESQPSNIVQVNSDAVLVNGFVPMTADEFAASKTKLADLTKHDIARRDLSASRNALEALIYQVKSDIDEEPFLAVTSEAQREDAMNKAVELSGWLDDVGDDFSTNDHTIAWYNARAALIDGKTKELNALIKPIMYRKTQYAEREHTYNTILNAFDVLLNSTTNFRNSKPWIVEQLDSIDERAASLKTELMGLYQEQQARDQSLDPVWINGEAIGKFTKLTEELKKAAKTPKPKAEKVETTEPDAAADGVEAEADVNANANADADEQQEQQEQQTQQSNDQDAAADESQQAQEPEKSNKPSHDEL